MTTLNDAFEWELTLEDIGYESGSESLSVPTPLCWTSQPFHVSTQENLSFGPATPSIYEEDKESSLDPRMEDHSLEEAILAHHPPVLQKKMRMTQKNTSPTASLDDNVSM